jgi:hypothetical protein
VRESVIHALPHRRGNTSAPAQEQARSNTDARESGYRPHRVASGPALPGPGCEIDIGALLILNEGSSPRHLNRCVARCRIGLQ